MDIKIGNLVNEITRAVQQYTQDVKDEVEKAADEISNNMVKAIKHGSPKLTGNYAKGWGRVKTKNGFIIRNRTDYQLTHLLEYGHAMRSGGRVAAHVHIRPVEEHYVKQFEKRVEKVIKG